MRPISTMYICKIYIYMYTHTYIYMYTHTHIYIHIYIYTHMHTYWWYIHTCIYTYIYLNSFILLVRIHHGKVNSYRLEVNFLCKPVAGILGSLRAVVSVFSYGTLSL